MQDHNIVAERLTHRAVVTVCMMVMGATSEKDVEESINAWIAKKNHVKGPKPFLRHNRFSLRQKMQMVASWALNEGCVLDVVNPPPLLQGTQDLTVEHLRFCY